MFAPEITDWLDGNTTAGARAYVRAHEAETIACLDALALDPRGEVAHFYRHFDPAAVRGWYELAAVDELADITDYAHAELGVPHRFMALTGIEGDGVVLLDRQAHAVYDVTFGQLDDLASGALAPVATSFEGFLRWCMAGQQRGAP